MDLSLNVTTYGFENFKLERGSHVERHGVKGEGSLVAWRTDEDGNLVTFTVAWKGYGENPGSRYSGLHSYYPAETEVFVYHFTTAKGTRRYRTLISWQTRPEKKRSEPQTTTKEG